MVMAPAHEEVFIEPVGQVLTGEEYNALPENPRREPVDGVIHMLATPRAWHQQVKFALHRALDRLRPTEVAIVEELEVRLAERLRRIPDVLTVRADGFDWQAAQLPPGQAVLAVECRWTS